MHSVFGLTPVDKHRSTEEETGYLCCVVLHTAVVHNNTHNLNR